MLIASPTTILSNFILTVFCFCAYCITKCCGTKMYQSAEECFEDGCESYCLKSYNQWDSVNSFYCAQYVWWELVLIALAVIIVLSCLLSLCLFICCKYNMCCAKRAQPNLKKERKLYKYSQMRWQEMFGEPYRFEDGHSKIIKIKNPHARKYESKPPTAL